MTTALEGYFQAIVGDEPASSFIEIRPMLPNDGGPARGRTWVSVNRFDKFRDHINKLAQTTNVFVGVAPRVRREGYASAVERVWTLWVDIDHEENLRKLAQFNPQPAIVVRSGSGGAHAYWPLSEPLTGPQAQRANRRLAAHLNADINATDAARILRPPGTLNHKHQPAKHVVCTRLLPIGFTAAEVVSALPDSEHYTKPRPHFKRSGEPESVLGRLTRVITTTPHGNRNAAFFWAVCCALEDDVTNFDALSSAALQVGLRPDEIRASIDSAQRTVGA